MDRKVLQRIGIQERYFSPSKLRAWANHELGAGFSLQQLADRLGWSKSSTRDALRGFTSPTLENYARAIAANDEEFDVWLDHVGRLDDPDG